MSGETAFMSRLKQNVIAYIFLIPALIFFFGFVIAPMAMGIVTSFTNSNMGGSQ